VDPLASSPNETWLEQHFHATEMFGVTVMMFSVWELVDKIDPPFHTE